ncbi:hypothetical protein HDU93_000668 [Gonapodya sp. JEL0774]|nr:hypothetical protein HDU93_000668 [Gonapodya sp. JEL0774]
MHEVCAAVLYALALERGWDADGNVVEGWHWQGDAASARSQRDPLNGVPITSSLVGSYKVEDTSLFLRTLLDPSYIEHDVHLVFSRIMRVLEPFYEHSPPQFGSAQATATAKPPIFWVCKGVQDEMVKWADPEVEDAMKRVGVEGQMYGIRFFRLLFAREFPLAAVLDLWDALFSSDRRFSLSHSDAGDDTESAKHADLWRGWDAGTAGLVEWTAVAIVGEARGELLSSSSATALRALMRFNDPNPTLSPARLAARAWDLRAQFLARSLGGRPGVGELVDPRALRVGSVETDGWTDLGGGASGTGTGSGVGVGMILGGAGRTTTETSRGSSTGPSGGIAQGLAQVQVQIPQALAGMQEIIAGAVHGLQGLGNLAAGTRGYGGGEPGSTRSTTGGWLRDDDETNSWGKRYYEDSGDRQRSEKGLYAAVAGRMGGSGVKISPWIGHYQNNENVNGDKPGLGEPPTGTTMGRFAGSPPVVQAQGAPSTDHPSHSTLPARILATVDVLEAALAGFRDLEPAQGVAASGSEWKQAWEGAIARLDEMKRLVESLREMGMEGDVERTTDIAVKHITAPTSVISQSGANKREGHVATVTMLDMEDVMGGEGGESIATNGVEALPNPVNISAQLPISPSRSIYEPMERDLSQSRRPPTSPGAAPFAEILSEARSAFSQLPSLVGSVAERARGAVGVATETGNAFLANAVKASAGRGVTSGVSLTGAVRHEVQGTRIADPLGAFGDD